MITVTLLLVLITATQQKCSNDVQRVPKYHLNEKCYRSSLGIVARANFSSITSCQRFGIEKRGLALNFSPPEVAKTMTEDDDPVEYSCQVLKCAESDGGTALVNDTRYDYYSLYSRNFPHINSSCVAGIGMFSLTPKLNYSDAQAQCRNRSSLLADILSEARTDALAQLLAGARVDAAFVGVSSHNGSEFVNQSGDTFDCTTYRAWAPGHPKRQRGKYGCVALSRKRTWWTVPCKTTLPALCELLPSGPYRRRGAIFASRKRNDTVKLPET